MDSPRLPSVQSILPPNTFFLLHPGRQPQDTRSQGSLTTVAHNPPVLAKEVNSWQAGAATGLTRLQVRRAAAAPRNAGATQHVRAAHPPGSCPGTPCQHPQRWAILREQTGGPQLGDEEELAGLGNGRRVLLRPVNRASESLVVVCKDRRARREGRRTRDELFSAQSHLLMRELVLALGHQQIQLCCYLLPCRNIYQL